MPSFGSNHSPSLRKMEVNNARYDGAGSGRNKMSVGNIMGDPFSLATIGIAIAGCLISFVSSIIVDIAEPFPNYVWWSLVYMILCVVGVIFATLTGTVHTFHVALTGFLSAGLVFTTSAVNSMIYSDQSARQAGAAGFILLSMICIVWIFYFGSQPQASHRQTIDSFALHKEHNTRASRNMAQSSYRPGTTLSNNNNNNSNNNNQQPAPTYNSANLAGFETSSPVTGHPGGRAGETKRESSVPGFSQPPGQPQTHPGGFAAAGTAGAQTQQDSSVSQPVDYPYRAKAIYSYEANPDDANEISFTKHEILEVSDVSGRWWQAKKENGETGIAPSNYLILL